MPILTRRAFGNLARKGMALPPGSLLRKEIAIDAAQIGEPEARRIRFTISTSSPDREYDTIAQDGWDLAAYAANPVVLLHHDGNDWPAGRGMDLSVEGDALKATVEFVPADLGLAGPRAETAYQLYRQGFMHAVSVGFRPLDWTIPRGEGARGDDWLPGVDFTRCDLVEFSLVLVPCNAEALIDPGEVASAVQAAAPPPTAPILASLPEAALRRRRLVSVLALA